MIHELIDPKKKTNKTTASRNTKTFQDNKPLSDHCTFEASDSENKEAESSSTTFIPPWLRNSLGLNQRNNQSHAAAGHSDQKPAKIIHRYKEPIHNEFETLKTNAEEDCCKKVPNQLQTLSSSCPQQENVPQNTDGVNNEDRAISLRWQVRTKESDTDSSCLIEEAKSFEKEDSKLTGEDVVVESGKLKDEERKKQMRFVRQKIKVGKRGVFEQKTAEGSKNEADCLLEMKTREALDGYLKKNVHTVPSDMKHLETKLSMLGAKRHNSNSVKLNPEELRILQDMKEQVGSIGDFDTVLEQVKGINMREIIKNPDILANSIGDKKVEYKEERSAREISPRYEDGKSNADKDSLLSTDDETYIKRFSEFLSKNKNAEKKRKCLEEVRNYFEKKRKTRMSRRRYLEEIKTKLAPESERKEEFLKEKAKCRELFSMATNRGKKSKFALCDEEVVEKAVDETLQKFVELYHFHVSPTVMGNMKKNILQAMQSDSMESSCSKINIEPEGKSFGKKIRNNRVYSPSRSQKGDLRSFDPQLDSPESPNKELVVHKDIKKKNFKTLIVSSNETLGKPKETDVVESERLKRLHRDFENFLHSIQSHIDVSNLKIQSVILEKEEQTDPAKHVQFVYNFAKKGLESERPGHWQALKEPQEQRTYKEMGVQASLKKEMGKKSVRIQAIEFQNTSEQMLQTEERTFASQPTQTEEQSVAFRELKELKELKSFSINPGLYRMVKSKEAGKFYLYPEKLEDEKEQVVEKSNSSVLKDRKTNKKRELLNVLSRERTRERRVYFKEKERGKLRRVKRTYYTVAHLKGGPSRREKSSGIVGKAGGAGAGKVGGKGGVVKSGSSISCLYFRNFEEKNSESLQSRKEIMPKKESGETGEKLGLGDTKEGEHLGCVWFWNGEKITPGCDLKTHVEDLLKEKLKEMADLDHFQNKILLNGIDFTKMENGPLTGNKNPPTKLDSKSVVCFADYKNCQESQAALAIERDCAEATEKVEEKKAEETEEAKVGRTSASQEKVVRNVGTQNSQQTILSFNLTKARTQSKMAVDVDKKKHSKRKSTVIRPVHRPRLANFQKAEGIIRAVEEIKKLKQELQSTKKNDSRDSESTIDSTSSSSGSKNDSEDPLSIVLGLREGSKPEIPRFKKIIGLVDHQVQTADSYDLEGANSEGSRGTAAAIESHKHLELIENVLCRVNQKERESLWNDVKEFIKTKIGRDINEDGAREVCIEIEQDVPKNEHGTVKHAVMARGHYVRNEGDVEVEIDLTLDDLEKILRQRQRRIRRQHMYRKR